MAQPIIYSSFTSMFSVCEGVFLLLYRKHFTDVIPRMFSPFYFDISSFIVLLTFLSDLKEEYQRRIKANVRIIDEMGTPLQIEDSKCHEWKTASLLLLQQHLMEVAIFNVVEQTLVDRLEEARMIKMDYTVERDFAEKCEEIKQRLLDRAIERY